MFLNETLLKDVIFKIFLLMLFTFNEIRKIIQTISQITYRTKNILFFLTFNS